MCFRLLRLHQSTNERCWRLASSLVRTFFHLLVVSKRKVNLFKAGGKMRLVKWESRQSPDQNLSNSHASQSSSLERVDPQIDVIHSISSWRRYPALALWTHHCKYVYVRIDRLVSVLANGLLILSSIPLFSSGHNCSLYQHLPFT